MSMLQNTLEEIRTRITNKTRLQFTHDEYQDMVNNLSFYVEHWKTDSLWQTAVKAIKLLEILCEQNVNFFTCPNDYDDNLDDKQDQSFNELQTLLQGL